MGQGLPGPWGLMDSRDWTVVRIESISPGPHISDPNALRKLTTFLTVVVIHLFNIHTVTRPLVNLHQVCATLHPPLEPSRSLIVVA